MIAENQITVEEPVLPVGQAPVPSKPEEVLDTRTPEEIEAALIQQGIDDATRMAENRDPADIAAMAFHLFYPRFKEQTMFLSNKELRRLVNALIGKGHQSEPEVPTFKDKRAGDAYKMGLELLSAKFMMITKLEMDQLQKKVDEDEAKKIAASAVIETQYGATEVAPEENKNEST